MTFARRPGTPLAGAFDCGLRGPAFAEATAGRPWRLGRRSLGGGGSNPLPPSARDCEL